jgi:hypothetical protein
LENSRKEEDFRFASALSLCSSIKPWAQTKAHPILCGIGALLVLLVDCAIGIIFLIPLGKFIYDSWVYGKAAYGFIFLRMLIAEPSPLKEIIPQLVDKGTPPRPTETPESPPEPDPAPQVEKSIPEANPSEPQTQLEPPKAPKSSPEPEPDLSVKEHIPEANPSEPQTPPKPPKAPESSPDRPNPKSRPKITRVDCGTGGGTNSCLFASLAYQLYPDQCLGVATSQYPWRRVRDELSMRALGQVKEIISKKFVELSDETGDVETLRHIFVAISVIGRVITIMEQDLFRDGYANEVEDVNKKLKTLRKDLGNADNALRKAEEQIGRAKEEVISLLRKYNECQIGEDKKIQFQEDGKDFDAVRALRGSVDALPVPDGEQGGGIKELQSAVRSLDEATTNHRIVDNVHTELLQLLENTQQNAADCSSGMGVVDRLLMQAIEYLKKVPMRNQVNGEVPGQQAAQMLLAEALGDGMIPGARFVCNAPFPQQLLFYISRVTSRPHALGELVDVAMAAAFHKKIIGVVCNNTFAPLTTFCPDGTTLETESGLTRENLDRCHIIVYNSATGNVGDTGCHWQAATYEGQPPPDKRGRPPAT